MLLGEDIVTMSCVRLRDVTCPPAPVVFRGSFALVSCTGSSNPEWQHATNGGPLLPPSYVAG